MSEHLPDGQYVGEALARRRVADLTLAETRYRPGTVIPSHAHATPLVASVTVGGMIEERGRRSVSCAPGTMIYQPPHEAHGHRFSENGGSCFILQFGSPWIERMDALGVTKPVVPLDLRRSQANWLLERIRGEFRSPDQAAGLAIEGYSLALLSELQRAKSRTREGVRPGWLIRAEELIHATLDDTPSLAEIAAAVDVHPVHLSRTFRRFYGCTLGEHVRRLRVRRAAEALVRTDLSLSRVALEAGFSDQAHFSRVFKRLMGCAPSVYRASSRSGNTPAPHWDRPEEAAG